MYIQYIYIYTTSCQFLHLYHTPSPTLPYLYKDPLHTYTYTYMTYTTTTHTPYIHTYTHIQPHTDYFVYCINRINVHCTLYIQLAALECYIYMTISYVT